MIRIEFDGLENEGVLDAATEEAIDEYFNGLSEVAAYQQGFFWSLWIEFLTKKKISIRKALPPHASEFISEFAATKGKNSRTLPSAGQIEALTSALSDIYDLALIPVEIAAVNPFKAS